MASHQYLTAASAPAWSFRFIASGMTGVGTFCAGPSAEAGTYSPDALADEDPPLGEAADVAVGEVAGAGDELVLAVVVEAEGGAAAGLVLDDVDVPPPQAVRVSNRAAVSAPAWVARRRCAARRTMACFMGPSWADCRLVSLVSPGRWSRSGRVGWFRGGV